MSGSWGDLPVITRTAVESVTGPIGGVVDLSQGIMPGLAVRLRTDQGDVFGKAVPVDSTAYRLYDRERRANATLPSNVPAPPMVWSGEVGGWLVLLFEFIEGRRADLSPGAPDLAGVLDTVAQMNKALAPSTWPAAPAVAEYVAALQKKAHALLNKPDQELPDRRMYLAALDGFDVADLAGNTLLHYDLHSGNLRATGGRVEVLDWAFACVGTAWVDAVMLAPRLIEAGHTPEQAETLVAALPAWDAAPSGAVTGLAALWTMFREYKARFGPADVRDARARAAAAGRAWVQHRAC